MELVRAYKFLTMARQGLSPYSLRANRWALQNTIAYYRHRKTLIKKERLGYSHQVVDLARTLAA